MISCGMTALFFVLVEEIEEGLRDEEGMCDANNDEFSELSECITYNSETFENGDT